MEYHQKENSKLIQKEKWGILASRTIRPHITQRVLTNINRINQLERVLVGGWHSPIEAEIHQYLIKKNIAHIHVEAKGLSNVSCNIGGEGVLFVTHCTDNVKRITRSNALKRNKLICELSDALLIPWLDPKGKTHDMVEPFCKEKPVIIFDPDYNSALREAGAKTVNEFSF